MSLFDNIKKYKPMNEQEAHDKETGDAGILVIGNTASDQEAVLLKGLIGLIDPVLSGRDYIGVAGDADFFIGGAELDGAAVALEVFNSEAVGLAAAKGKVQHVAAVRTKGCTGLSEICAGNRGMRGPLNQLIDHFVTVVGHPLVKLTTEINVIF